MWSAMQLPRWSGRGRCSPAFAPSAFPVALVLQDGQQDGAIPWEEIDAVFVGGTTEFKLGRVASRLTAEAKARGK
jgi:hypothetical protein